MATRPTDTSDWREADSPDTADTIEPSSGKKAAGWGSGEKPPHQYMNWLFWLFNKVHKYFDEVFHAEHNQDTGKHKDITINDIKISRSAAQQLLISNLAGGILSNSILINSNDVRLRRSTVGTFFYLLVDGDAKYRLAIYDAGLSIGPGGSGDRDVRLYRSEAKTITIDDNASSDLTQFILKAVLVTLNGTIQTTSSVNSTRIAANPGFTVSVTGDGNVSWKRNADGSEIYGDGTGTMDVRARRPSGKTYELDDNAGGNLTKIELKTALLALAGDIDMASGKYIYSPSVSRAILSSGTNTSTSANKLIDSGASFTGDGIAAGDQIINVTDSAYTTVTAVDSDIQLSITSDYFLATSKSYKVVANGIANDGKFLGGNGATIWFSGEAYTSATIINSTIDWRDRLVEISGFYVMSATPSIHLPGGSSDAFSGSRDYNPSTLAVTSFNLGDANFYGHNGASSADDAWTNGGGSYLRQSDRPANPDGSVFFYADSSTGALKMQLHSTATGSPFAVVVKIEFSPDQGVY